jgi:hypoxanthine phosphoribosyltransferase
MPKIYYSKPETDQLISELIEKIKISHEATCPPRFIACCGIENGGVNISKKVAEALELEHRTVKISRYHKKLIVETNFFHVDLYKRGVLILDDLIDKGTTLKIFEKNCGFRTQDAVAVLIWKKCKLYKPEFYVKEEDEDNWCVFPWG